MINEDKLKEVIAAVLAVEASEVKDDSSSDTIETWDSFAQMNLILALEEEYDISVPDDEAANLSSYPLIRLVVKELTGDE
ncbi:MAG: acyl carrier protein [Halobacteriovoraceae bacterium]|jgi:acyl carrier protein|nr:acyl carrier protein [Halobacteriovoraceae bacterium]